MGAEVPVHFGVGALADQNLLHPEEVAAPPVEGPGSPEEGQNSAEEAAPRGDLLVGILQDTVSLGNGKGTPAVGGIPEGDHSTAVGNPEGAEDTVEDTPALEEALLGGTDPRGLPVERTVPVGGTQADQGALRRDLVVRVALGDTVGRELGPIGGLLYSEDTAPAEGEAPGWLEALRSLKAVPRARTDLERAHRGDLDMEGGQAEDTVT